MDLLKTECPEAMADSVEEMEQATVDMRSRYEETLEYIGRHAPVSIPG
jgi:predicted nucleotide-binding protein (sugar kinase/HSP70/actin superfamily)